MQVVRSQSRAETRRRGGEGNGDRGWVAGPVGSLRGGLGGWVRSGCDGAQPPRHGVGSGRGWKTGESWIWEKSRCWGAMLRQRRRAGNGDQGSVAGLVGSLRGGLGGWVRSGCDGAQPPRHGVGSGRGWKTGEPWSGATGRCWLALLRQPRRPGEGDRARRRRTRPRQRRRTRCSAYCDRSRSRRSATRTNLRNCSIQSQ